MAVSEMIGTAGRPREALVYALRAAARGPRDAFAINATGIALWGTASSLALASVREAARLDPLDLYPPLNSSELLAYLGRADEALAYADTVLHLEAEMPMALSRRALALIELERSAEASALVAPLERQAAEGRLDPEFATVIKDGVTLLGADAAAKRTALDRLERLAVNPAPFAEYPRIYVWLVRHGRVAAALDAIEQRARAGRVPYDFLRLTPEFKALATNERYLRVLGIARTQFDEMIALLREAEGRGELPPFMQQPLADLLRTLGINSGQRAQRASDRDMLAPPVALR